MAKTVNIGHKSDFPNEAGRSVEVDGKKIAVFRVGDAFYALDDTCPHQGGPLSEGDIDSGRVTCPWHGAVFKLNSGAVEDGPAEEPVTTYPVRIVGEDVEIEV